MKRYTVSKARERLADVLNEVDRSGAVTIARGDVQYEIRVKRAVTRRTGRPSVIESVDPAVAAGQWQWAATATGVRFKARRS